MPIVWWLHLYTKFDMDSSYTGQRVHAHNERVIKWLGSMTIKGSRQGVLRLAIRFSG